MIKYNIITTILINVHIVYILKLKPNGIFLSLYVDNKSIGKINIIINEIVKPVTIKNLVIITP